MSILHKRICGIFICIISLFTTRITYGQTIIPMIEERGVYKIPCEINGLKVKMIFDTGATSVSISESLAEMMLDNGYILKSDVLGKTKSIIADGSIIELTNVVLRSIKIGNIKLSNIHAVIAHRQNAPLLFGQSAIQMLGEISIKDNKLIIKNTNSITADAVIETVNERWDAQNYNYTNFKYGFGWSLPKDFEWKKVAGFEKHTVFRAQYNGLAVFANIKGCDLKINLWDTFDKFVEYMEKLDVALEKSTGTIYYERTFEKCTIVGQQAFKTTYKEYFKDSRYTEADEVYAEEYYFLLDGLWYAIVVKMPKIIRDAFDYNEVSSAIFKGFRLSVKH